MSNVNCFYIVDFPHRRKTLRSEAFVDLSECNIVNPYDYEAEGSE